MVHILKKWLPWAFLATVFAGLVYVAVQQSYRLSANDPQIQMAEDIAVLRAAGSPLVTSTSTIDIGKSLAPYLVIYDAEGKPMWGNGMLAGALPNLPPGVFDFARSRGEDRFTWQPQPGVRSAVILTAVNGGHDGFVMAGRSLREVELREEQLGSITLAVWIAMLIGTFAILAIVK